MECETLALGTRSCSPHEPKSRTLSYNRASEQETGRDFGPVCTLDTS